MFVHEIKPGAVWLSRVIALPGEGIHFVDSTIYINGKKLDYPKGFSIRYLPQTDEHNKAKIAYPYTVPDSFYFCLGDNTTDAEDSRYIGPTHRSKILGKITDPSIKAVLLNAAKEGK